MGEGVEEKKRNARQTGRREMLSSIDERSIDPRFYAGARFPFTASFTEGTFVPRHRASPRITRGGGTEGGGGRVRKLSYDVNATLPKVARYGNEARLEADRETHPRSLAASCVSHRLRKLSRFPSSSRRDSSSLLSSYLLPSLRASPFLLRSKRDKALFQDLPALFAQDRRHVSFANRRSEVDPLT